MPEQRDLVSVVTPTFPGREKQLLERCIPSVLAQDWRPLEHVIISDPNPALREHFKALPQDDYFRFIEINETWKNPATKFANGAVPWMLGSRLALGEFVGFLGDDDELHPDHVSVHVAAMKAADAVWSLSKVDFRANGDHWAVVGDNSFAAGRLDATGIMCWKGALSVASWDPAAGHPAVDWKLVDDWRQAGLVGVFIDQVTGIHHDGWLTGKTGQPYD